jgi:hypothetical protein
MQMRYYFAMGALVGILAVQGYSADALTMHECSVKYKAAKDAGTLNDMKWKDFRRAQCGSEVTAAPATASAPPPAYSPTPQPAPVTFGSAVFPSAIDPRYSTKSPGKARMETCLEQYRANKANNGNGGLRWIQRGGGYYSECNRRLKGQA